MKETNEPSLSNPDFEIKPSWAILIKHLEKLNPERYPLFSVRKVCVDAMEEYASYENGKLKASITGLESELIRAKEVMHYAMNKIYILENTKKAVSGQCKRDLMKMKGEIESFLKEVK